MLAVSELAFPPLCHPRHPSLLVFLSIKSGLEVPLDPVALHLVVLLSCTNRARSGLSTASLHQRHPENGSHTCRFHAAQVFYYKDTFTFTHGSDDIQALCWDCWRLPCLFGQ